MTLAEYRATGRGGNKKSRRPRGPPADSSRAYSLQRVNQSMTSVCHWMEFWGFNTQWFSSG